MPSEATQRALDILRDGSQFSWYVIPFLLVVIYVYFVEIDKKNWSRVLAALAFWGMDWFNEIWNALVLHFSGYAPVWLAPGDTAYLIFVGLNIEICFMFAITGIVATMALPADRNASVLGINNRLFFAIVMSALSVCVEMMLNSVGALVWHWSWWGREAPWLIFLIGYLPFYLVCYWIYDMPSRKKQLYATGAILGFDALAILVFGFGLGWL